MYGIRTDADHCRRLLLCEDITTLAEASELFSDLPGGQKLLFLCVTRTSEGRHEASEPCEVIAQGSSWTAWAKRRGPVPGT